MIDLEVRHGKKCHTIVLHAGGEKMQCAYRSLATCFKISNMVMTLCVCARVKVTDVLGRGLMCRDGGGVIQSAGTDGKVSGGDTE